MEGFNLIYVRQDSSPPSFDIADSDYYGNAVLMEQLVGTLIKMTELGRYEPYLAKSWTASDDKKTWRFSLRENLYCENGEKITASSFKKSIERSLKRYKKQFGNVPIFSKLVHWRLGDEISGDGIVASGETLIFNFSEPVKSGLLEFLAMPYYGFLCEENFDKNDSWKDSKKIISSGAFRLLSWDGIENLKLIKRDDWSLNNKWAPGSVLVIKAKDMAAFSLDAPKILEFTSGYQSANDEGIKVIKSIPSMFYGPLLLPNSKNFSSRKNRKAFQKAFVNVQRETILNSEEFSLSQAFYPAQRTEVVTSKSEELSPLEFEEPIKVVTYLPPEGAIKTLEEMVIETLKALGVSYTVHRLDRSSSNFIQKLMEGDYDIRIQRVDAGGGFESWAIEMMFCSKLGARLPDPSGRICALVKAFESNEIEINDCLQEFNQAIFDDASVIPAMHGSRVWLFPKNLDVDISSSITLVPFDRLRLVK